MIGFFKILVMSTRTVCLKLAGKIKSRQNSVFKVVNLSKSTRLCSYKWSFSCSWSFPLLAFGLDRHITTE